jgi:hypothetical protein
MLKMQTAERYNTTAFPANYVSIATRRLHALEVWQFINIFLLSLVTGVFWGTWLGLSRSMSSLSAATFLEVGHTMIGNLGTVMALLMPVAMLSTLPVLYLLYRKRPKRFYVTLLGFMLFVLALLITLLVEVPLDFQFQQWTLATLPANWQQLRDRWELFHFLRSSFAVIGLSLLIAGALFWRDRYVATSRTSSRYTADLSETKAPAR